MASSHPMHVLFLLLRLRVIMTKCIDPDIFFDTVAIRQGYSKSRDFSDPHCSDDRYCPPQAHIISSKINNAAKVIFSNPVYFENIRGYRV
jgi:hypothetical protein